MIPVFRGALQKSEVNSFSGDPGVIVSVTVEIEVPALTMVTDQCEWRQVKIPNQTYRMHRQYHIMSQLGLTDLDIKRRAVHCIENDEVVANAIKRLKREKEEMYGRELFLKVTHSINLVESAS